MPDGQVFRDGRQPGQQRRQPVFWGFVPRELIVGKALIVYWSYESDSEAYRQTEVRDSSDRPATSSRISSERPAGRVRLR